MAQPLLDPKAFGERLIGSRIAAGLNRGELAKRSGVSKRSIDGYEAGVRIPLAGVPALADALGVDPHWLVFGTSWNVERLGALATELHDQTEALRGALRFADVQWEAFGARLVALEVSNARILTALAEILSQLHPTGSSS